MDEKLKRIANYYSFHAQLRQLMEECCELAVECNHTLRKGLADKLVGELVDVEIMIEQIKYLCGCQKEFEGIKKYKIDRQLERIQEQERTND